ncbi:hypothetical protein GCM10009753_72980 [Streptantibioticus ferralitis]
MKPFNARRLTDQEVEKSQRIVRRPGLPGPRWVGGRPRLFRLADADFVVQTATTRPVRLGQPFTRWSIRNLLAYLRKVHGTPYNIRDHAADDAAASLAQARAPPSTRRTVPVT